MSGATQDTLFLLQDIGAGHCGWDPFPAAPGNAVAMLAPLQAFSVVSAFP